MIDLNNNPNARMKLEARFKSKADLYDYLVNTENICLPLFKNCSLQFIQAIVADEKKFFVMSEIKRRHIHQYWGEFAVKNMWPLVQHNEEARKYLPAEEIDEGKYPDRDFFWNVLCTLNMDWCERYYQEVAQQRNIARMKNNHFERQIINISERWLNKMVDGDFIPSAKRTKQKQTILLQQNKKRERKAVERRIQKIEFDDFSYELDKLPKNLRLDKSEILEFSQDEDDNDKYEDAQDGGNDASIINNQDKPLDKSMIQQQKQLLTTNKKRKRRDFLNQSQIDQTVGAVVVQNKFKSPDRKKIKQIDAVMSKESTDKKNKSQYGNSNKKMQVQLWK